MTDKEKREWQKYIDNKISHAVGAVEYGNYFYEQVKEIAYSAKEDCEDILAEYKRCGTKTKCSVIKEDLDKRLEEAEEELAHFINTELPKIIENENEWLDNNVAPYLGIQFDKVRSALSMLAVIPIAQIVSASTFPANTVNKLKDIYDSILKQSLVTGSPFEDTKDDYIPRFNAFDKQLETEAETLGHGLSDQYDRIIFTKNDKKIHKYMWCAILDTTTCLPEGEKVLTPEGYKNIEDIQTGDIVIGGSRQPRKVKNTFQKKAEELIEIECENGNFIRCTPEHKILTKRGWVEAQFLEVTDEIEENL